MRNTPSFLGYAPGLRGLQGACSAASGARQSLAGCPLVLGDWTGNFLGNSSSSNPGKPVFTGSIRCFSILLVSTNLHLKPWFERLLLRGLIQVGCCRWSASNSSIQRCIQTPPSRPCPRSLWTAVQATSSSRLRLISARFLAGNFKPTLAHHMPTRSKQTHDALFGQRSELGEVVVLDRRGLQHLVGGQDDLVPHVPRHSFVVAGQHLAVDAVRGQLLQRRGGRF